MNFATGVVAFPALAVTLIVMIGIMGVLYLIGVWANGGVIED